MAINTQSEYIADLQWIAGQNDASLSETDAVRNLNFGLNRYTYLMLFSDGKTQGDDAQYADDSISKTSAPITANDHAISLETEFHTIALMEIEDASGYRTRLDPFDMAEDGRTTPKSTDTGRPSKYDYFGGVFYFDVYADAAYTLRVFYGRSYRHLEVGQPNQVVGIPDIHAEFPINYAARRLGFRTGDMDLRQLTDWIEKEEKDIQEYWANLDEDVVEKLGLKAQLIS